eukprot:scaffold1580_cov116-Cylindrotheca_fusiformis.AAC.9
MYNEQDDVHQNHWIAQQDQAQSFEQFMRENDPNGAANVEAAGSGDLYDSRVAGPPREITTSFSQHDDDGSRIRRRSIYDTSSPHSEDKKLPPGIGTEDVSESDSESSEEKPPPVQMQVVGIGIDEPTIRAPFESMVNDQSREEEDRQRSSWMPSAQSPSRAKLPAPSSATPLPPNQFPVEPSMPHARLGRRCLAYKPKREPELVKGLVVSGGRANRAVNQIHVSCAKCGAALQISKNAIAVSCPGCYKISPAASCIINSR